MSKMAEAFQFLMTQKKYWLLPMTIVVAILGSVVIFSHLKEVAPFIYTLF
jgi:hypothetical protein